MKNISACVVIVFCSFLLPSVIFAESCSGVGTKQYKPKDTCLTVERTCCQSGIQWSEWGESCPACECTPAKEETLACDSGQSGNKKRICNSSCAWDAWDTSGCISMQITNYQLNVLVEYSIKVSSWEHSGCWGDGYCSNESATCGGVTSKSYYRGGSLYQSAYYGYSGPNDCGGGDGQDDYYSGWAGGTKVTGAAIVKCPSGSNADICTSKCTYAGCTFECLISESIPPGTSASFTTGAQGGCESTTVLGCNDQAGSATILKCKR